MPLLMLTWLHVVKFHASRLTTRKQPIATSRTEELPVHHDGSLRTVLKALQEKPHTACAIASMPYRAGAIRWLIGSCQVKL